MLVTVIFSCKKDGASTNKHQPSQENRKSADVVASKTPIIAPHQVAPDSRAIENNHIDQFDKPNLDLVTFDIAATPLRTKLKTHPYLILKMRLMDHLLLGINDPIWDEFDDLKKELGDYSFHLGSQPDQTWDLNKIVNWIRILTPICKNITVLDEFFTESKYQSTIEKIFNRLPNEGEISFLNDSTSEELCIFTLAQAEYMIL